MGSRPPTSKLARRLGPKRCEIAYRFQQTHYAHCDVLSWGTIVDPPPTSPLPPKLGDGLPSKICIAIGSLTERDSVSVPANKLCIIWRSFNWCHTRPLTLPLPQIGGRSPKQNLYCDWLVKERDRISVPANKLYLIWRTFKGCHTRPLAQPPPQIRGRSPSNICIAIGS